VSIGKKEFIVTVKSYDVLESFYKDMKDDNPISSFIPKRSVECLLQRPTSRNTHYLLTDDEARRLAQDPRVESVIIKVKGLGVKTKLHSDQIGIWNRSSNIAVDQKNYGLYRISLENNIPGWGSESVTSEEISNIKINATGKNVDIIVLDETAYPDHSEFEERLIQYDWYDQLDEYVRGDGVLITDVERVNNQAIITTASPHRLKVGEVINVTCTSDNSFSVIGATVNNIPSPNQIRYSNAGINVNQSSATGFWRGVYQYSNYDGPNNHATHVAAVIGGNTQGWARNANIYNLKHNANSQDYDNFDYPDSDLLIDYVRQFHNRKSINPETGRKNPTIVNNSWGFGADVAFLSNPYTDYQFSRFSKLFYRGSFVESAGPIVDTGISGVCSGTDLLEEINTSPESGNRVVTSGGDIVSVNPITFENSERINLVDLGSPTISSADGVDEYDDAYWTVSLPFNISYLGSSYSTIYVTSNSFITFGTGSVAFFLGYGLPAARKIFISAGDRSVDAVYAGVTSGTEGEGNRVYTIRWEGYDGAYGNLEGNGVETIWEMKFYEETPAQIDIHIVTNSNYRAEFTDEELQSYGLNMSGPPSPYRNVAMDADISDAINEGIIFVGSAGNSSAKIEVEDGIDYDNYFVDNGLPIYYHRGSTPGSSSSVICVGEVSSVSTESKSQNSNTGPRVDLYAPGENVISAVYNGLETSIIPVVNDGSTTFELSIGSSVTSGNGAIVTVITENPHGLTNGDIVTIPNCSTSFFNSGRVPVTVIDSTSFSYSINIPISTGFIDITGTNNNKFTAANVNTIDINMPLVLTEQTGSLTLNGDPISSETIYYVREINYGLNEFTLGSEPDGVSLNAEGSGTASFKNKITGTVYEGFLYQKLRGTSIAAAQVTGVLALAMEKYPWMNQNDARNYILSYAKNNILAATQGGYNDTTSLQGGENKFLFYYKERPDSGITVPRSKEWLRPSNGLLFPRPVIRKK
jgi:hypothetical protein